jgi:hypothetical protein
MQDKQALKLKTEAAAVTGPSLSERLLAMATVKLHNNMAVNPLMFAHLDFKMINFLLVDDLPEPFPR